MEIDALIEELEGAVTMTEAQELSIYLTEMEKWNFKSGTESVSAGNHQACCHRQQFNSLSETKHSSKTIGTN